MKRSKFSTIASKVQSREFGTLSIWAFGIVVVLAALWAHRVSNWADPDSLPPFLFFYPAVVIAALAGGPKLGVASAILSTVVAWYANMRPEFSFSLHDNHSVFVVSLFLLTSILIGWAVGRTTAALAATHWEREERAKAAREAVHRIRNLLAVIQSILVKVAQNTESVTEYRDIMCDRLQALGSAQNLLLRSDWSDIDISELVRASLAPFLPNPSLRVTDGPDGSVPARLAGGLSLGLFELATNSAKHGLLAKRSAHVDVGWSVNDNIVTLNWFEPVEGVGAKTEGFGTKLITHALKGHPTTEVDYLVTPSSVEARFSWPTD